MTNYLGIDYGLSHIGLALAEAVLATPLPELKNDSSLIPHLTSLISQHGVSHIVVGLPSGPVAESVKQFVAVLSSATNLPISLHDETLSSHEAKQKLLESGAKKSKRRSEHSYSAVLILEDFLESAKL